MTSDTQASNTQAIDSSKHRITVQTFLYTGLLCVGIGFMVNAFGGGPLWANMTVSFAIGWSINLSFLLFGALISRWINPYLASIPLTAMGMAFGLTIAGVVVSGDPWFFFFGEYDTMVVTAFFGIVGFAIFSTRGRLADTEAELARATVEYERQERLLAQTELRLLQAQIEPHFLFNTLSNIAGLIHTQPDNAEKTLLNLTTLLRSTLKRTREQDTTVREELIIARAYLDIQAIRMQGRLSYNINCAEELEHQPLSPLLVQPLIENAVTHGIESEESGGSIDLQISSSEGQMRITVADTGHGLDAENSAPGTGTGLRNVRERLRALYGEDAQLTLTENTPRGMIATLTLPLDSAPPVPVE